MREEFNLLIKSSATRTVPATKTKSIGLQADARVVMVFETPPRQFYRDMTNPAHLSGPRHLDNFILTRNLHTFIGTLQKRMPTLTPLATARGRLTATQLNRRAVSTNCQHKFELATRRNLLKFSLYSIINNSIWTLPSLTFPKHFLLPPYTNNL